VPDVSLDRAAYLTQVSHTKMRDLCVRHELGRKHGGRWKIARERLQALFDSGLAQPKRLNYHRCLDIFRWYFLGYVESCDKLDGWFLAEIQQTYGSALQDEASIPVLAVDRLRDRYRTEVLQLPFVENWFELP
jgi:hypothetical protein